MQIGYFLHAQPAKVRSTDGTGHVVARAIVHLGDEGFTARTGLNLTQEGRRGRREECVARHSAERHSAHCSCRRQVQAETLSARLVAGRNGMPYASTVVAEGRPTFFTLAHQPRTFGTTCCNYSVPAT